MQKLVECVPNFSEGRDKGKINDIVQAIASARTGSGDEKVKVLNIDPGEAANRTVITFIGSPEAVCEAAFQGCRKAIEVIDMRTQSGTHPRLGAIDVLPLVPVSGITLEECAQLARDLSERMWKELGIPCYCYEASAFRPQMKNLAVCREGEYEALPQKLSDPGRRPDFGPETFHAAPDKRSDIEKKQWETIARCGASNVGARNFLIAVNFNLNTTCVKTATSIAFDVREKGRIVNDGGIPVHKPGTLKGCKALGWYIDEHGIAQVSMNITDMNLTPLHVAYQEVCKAAHSRGVEVTGTEIIGLVPKRVLTDAGLHFLKEKGENLTTGEKELIEVAISTMGLDELRPFRPEEKILEFLMGD